MPAYRTAGLKAADAGLLRDAKDPSVFPMHKQGPEIGGLVQTGAGRR
jgi:hypothetical protein